MSILPDMSGVVAMFGVPVTRRRYDGAPTRNADGYLVPPSGTDTTITMHYYPAQGEVLERLSEGHRPTDILGFGTPDDVRTSTEGGARADEIVIGSEVYEVQLIQPYIGPSGGTSGYIEGGMVRVNR